MTARKLTAGDESATPQLDADAGPATDALVAAADGRLRAAFAARVAAHRQAAGEQLDPRIGADTTRELLAVVETLTRRELARGGGPADPAGSAHGLPSRLHGL
jgi:hypothetical protein